MESAGREVLEEALEADELTDTLGFISAASACPQTNTHYTVSCGKSNCSRLSELEMMELGIYNVLLKTLYWSHFTCITHVVKLK